MVEHANRHFVEEDGGAAVRRYLQTAGDERAVAEEFVEGGEEVRVKRQAVEGLVIGELAVQDSLRPVIVEMHVALPRQQKGGRGQPDQNHQAKEKDASENVGGDRD